MVSLLTYAAVLASVCTVYLIARLGVADADLCLLWKGRHKKNAFRGKIIWITGASQGLGRLLSTYLAQQDACLILSSRRLDKLQKVKEDCRQTEDHIVLLPFDVCGSEEEIADAVRKATTFFKGRGIDYLVHMAGASQHSLASETTAAVADSLMTLNACAPIRLTQAVLPHFLGNNRGRFVVIGSLAGKVPSPGQAVYSAAKMAIYGYFSTLATEISDTNVGVTLCLPGPVASPGPTRSVYSAHGLREVPVDPAARGRLPAERAISLIADAMAHGLDEAWIAKHPVLALAYLQQFLPALALALLKRVGPRRARALQEGRGGYDAGMLLGAEKGKGKGSRGESVGHGQEGEGKEDGAGKKEK